MKDVYTFLTDNDLLWKNRIFLKSQIYLNHAEFSKQISKKIINV